MLLWDKVKELFGNKEYTPMPEGEFPEEGRFYLKDTTDYARAVGKHKSGYMDPSVVTDVARRALNAGVDPNLAGAVAWMESNFGKYDRKNPMRVNVGLHMGAKKGTKLNPNDVMTKAFQILRDKVSNFSSPVWAAQAYNGLGVFDPKKYFGNVTGTNKYYGRKGRIDTRVDPVYGNIAQEYAGVLRENPAYQNAIKELLKYEMGTPYEW